MKKIFILMFMIVLLVGTISAWDWDNLKSYDEELQEITVTNALGLGRDITKIKLNTPVANAVGYGSQKVIEYEINSVQESKVFISNFELLDANNGMQTIEKDLDFKIKVITEQIVPEYGLVCEGLNLNGTERCFTDVIAYHKINKTTWEFFDKTEFLEGEVVTIGVFTNVEIGEHIEWIPTFTIGVIEDNGKEFRVPEWASWYGTLNADLFAWYNFDSDASDSVGTYANIDLDDDGAYAMRDGKIGNAQNSSCIAGNGTGFNNFKTKTNDDWTICFWSQADSAASTERLFGMDDVTAGIYTDFHSVRAYWSANAFASSILDKADTLGPTTGTGTDWYLNCHLRNETGYYFYLNNTLGASDTAIAGTWTTENNALTLNSNNKPDTGCADEGLDGYDEWGMWNRGLSETDMDLVWNGGAGISYTVLFATLLSSPMDYFNTSDSTPDLSCNFTGDDTERIIDVKVLVYDSGNNLDYTNTESSLNYISYNKTWTTTELTDDTYLWACLGTGNTTTKYDGNRTFNVDTTAPLINGTYPIDYVTYQILSQNLTFNWTVSDAHLQSCWYDYNTTNISVTCLDNSTQFNITSYSNRNLTFYANDSLGNEGSIFVSWSYKVFQNNVTYNAVTTEGATETFKINFIQTPTVQTSTINLIYNQTSYSSVFFITGDEVIGTNTIGIPNQDIASNPEFYWSMLMSDGSVINTTIYNQIVNVLQVDDCTVYAHLAYNYTLLEEENQSKLTNTTIEIQLNLYDLSREITILNFSQLYKDVNPAKICFNTSLLNTINYSVDSVVKYTATLVNDSYAKEYYNILGNTLNNLTIPNHINLYSLALADSTDFQLTFRDDSLSLAANIIVYVYRQYVADNDFKIVEAPLTDSNGQTVLHLVRNDIIYNFVMKDATGTVVATFNKIIAFCQDYTIGSCQIELSSEGVGDFFYDYIADIGISYTTTYSNTTELISFNFVSDDLTPKTVQMDVIRNSVFGNRTVCQESLTSASGIITCDVSSITSTDRYLFYDISVDGDLKTGGTIDLESDAFNFGAQGAFIAFFMILAIILMSSGDKKVLIISIVLGWIGVISFGLIEGTVIGVLSGTVWLIVIAIILLWKLRKEEVFGG